MWYLPLMIAALAAALLGVARLRSARRSDPGYDQLVAGVRAAVLEGPGATPTGLRQAVAARAGGPEAGASRAAGVREVDEELRPLVDKVAGRAYEVTDADIATLRQAGYDEDAVFEVVVSAALGAGTARLRRGLAALEASREDHHAS